MKWNRTLAAGLSAALLLTSACSSGGSASSGTAANGKAPAGAPAADAVVMTVNGQEYTAAEYAAFLSNSRAEWQTFLSYYGTSEEEYLEGVDAAEYGESLRSRAEDYLVLNNVLNAKMEEYGLTLSEEDENMLETYRKLGMDDSYLRLQQMLTKVTEYCTGEEGDYGPSEDEIQDYFEQNYLRCKHVLIKTVDDSYNDLENQDELEATAKEVAKRAKAGEDFDGLIAAYGEDPGMTASPDGYVFAEGTMVDEFYQGTLALDEGGISDPIKSSYGWHIIQRLPLRDEDRASVESEIISALSDFDSVLQEWVDAADVKVEDAAAGITYENCADYRAED